MVDMKEMEGTSQPSGKKNEKIHGLPTCYKMTEVSYC